MSHILDTIIKLLHSNSNSLSSLFLNSATLCLTSVLQTERVSPNRWQQRLMICVFFCADQLLKGVSKPLRAQANTRFHLSAHLVGLSHLLRDHFHFL